MDSTLSCILLFSGGRDSTLSAVRLARVFSRLILVTVSSDHLVGIEKVKDRLVELRPHLPADSTWFCVQEPVPQLQETLTMPTCLPCHRAYVVVGTILARRLAIADLAFGYVGYQNSWPEQTPDATGRLGSILAAHGIRLHLPVYDVAKKEQAIDELSRLRLTPQAMEQKCLQQQFNTTLHPDVLAREVEQWESSVLEVLAVKDSIDLSILRECRVEAI